VLDDADFAENEMIDELLFALSRRTQSFTVIVAQNFRFLERLSDSVRSSLLPRVLIFKEYTQDELYQILKMRAEDGLLSHDDVSLRLLSALVARDYRGDARVAIRALFYLGQKTSGAKKP